MKKRIKFKPTISESKLTDKTSVQILHMDDYFGEDGPWAGKPHTWKQFQEDNAYEDEEFNLEDWYAASGDGQENYCLLTVIDGQAVVVTP